MQKNTQTARPATASSAIPFPDEMAHLDETLLKLDCALAEAESSVDRIDKDYMDAKLYMVQNRGDIDPHEMFQNELALRDIDSSGAFAVQLRDRLAKLADSPYFARIDFKAEGDEAAEAYYIGRFTFTHQNEWLVLDWRAPLAGMFYDCQVGPAGYDAPRGRVEGTLTRKRQFQIKAGRMEYALESSDNIQDDVLQRELSRTSDEKMKSIIHTIQREQNQIIRNERAGTLIIQGVAGSGKTSIALHRVAFLLYRHKDRLSAQNVTILSPNRVFGDYIANVLPELGEEPIFEVSFGDIADIQLEKVMGFEADRDPMEAQDEGWASRTRFKSTLDFVWQMDDYIAGLPQTAFAAKEYAWESFAVSPEWIRARMAAYEKHPLHRRLALVADDIHERFETDNIREYELPKPRTILKALKAMLTVKNTLALYRGFYRHIGRPDLLVLPNAKKLEWNDVFPFLYLHAAFVGLKESGVIRHLVIDEMQDYTPIQYAVINKLFRCQKTILGDFSQTINPNHRHTLADLRQLYQGAEAVHLTRSYRSTLEIIRFARGISPTADLVPMERHGPPPRVLACRDEGDELARLEQLVTDFAAGPHNTMGIIAKSNTDAKRLYQALQGRCAVSLLSPESMGFAQGVSVTSVPMSKGLEFDEVAVPGAGSAAYHTEDDRRLLFVACTRAMHKLTLLHTGEKSPWLAFAR